MNFYCQIKMNRNFLIFKLKNLNNSTICNKIIEIGKEVKWAYDREKVQAFLNNEEFCNNSSLTNEGNRPTMML